MLGLSTVEKRGVSNTNKRKENRQRICMKTKAFGGFTGRNQEISKPCISSLRSLPGGSQGWPVGPTSWCLAPRETAVELLSPATRLHDHHHDRQTARGKDGAWSYRPMAHRESAPPPF